MRQNDWRPGQPKPFPQRAAFVFPLRQSSALQFRDGLLGEVDPILRNKRKHQAQSRRQLRPSTGLPSDRRPPQVFPAITGAVPAVAMRRAISRIVETFVGKGSHSFQVGALAIVSRPVRQRWDGAIDVVSRQIDAAPAGDQVDVDAFGNKLLQPVLLFPGLAA